MERRAKPRVIRRPTFFSMNSCASVSPLESRVRKAGPRPLVGLAALDRDNLKLIVRRPIPNEQEAPRSPSIFRQFASSRYFSNRLGIPSGYELEEIREQFHWIFRLFSGVTVTRTGVFHLFSKANEEAL